MREIKYRIPWYSVSGVFQGFTYWGRIDSKELFSLDCFTSPGQWGSRRAKPDEQFTGLRDKNGKEIYEGDQCNVLTADGRVTHAHVVFIDGCFELYFISPVVIDGKYHTRDYLKCSVVNHAVEVIGNIHENPELLEAKP